jgi:hypothetical protein
MSAMPTVEIITGPDHMTDDEGWEHHAYSLRVDFEGRSMVTPWRQGVGITDDPEVHDVMSAMISDTSGVLHGETFEDWADEYGYDTDSRKAEATYRAVVAQTEGLRRLLGDDLLHRLTHDEYDDAVYGNASRFALAWARATRASV